MDKTASTKETRQKRLNARINARACLIAGILVGFVVICLGAIKIHGYYVELGDATPDELSEKITELSEELAKVDAEKWEENEKNGFSDKYVELNNRSAELSAEISRATNSQYMKETGYNNPKSSEIPSGCARKI